ncbi:MAG TPA: IclR family transcriptional regulator [Chloroflexota bacterium]|nr:IclR family transcriptional regulator [Chloroflexota bacterium]
MNVEVRPRRPRDRVAKRGAVGQRRGATSSGTSALVNGEIDEPKYHERGLLRGLQILSAFSVERPEHDLSSLSEMLQLPKATLVRLLDCLRFAGFVETDPDTSRYRLGLKAFEVGCVYQHTASIRLLARPVIEDLAYSLGYSTNLGILDNGEVLHITVVLSPRPIRYDGYTGQRSGAHCSGLGKVLLADFAPAELQRFLQQYPLTRYTSKTITDPAVLREALAQVKRQGYAMDDEESSLGLRCVAAPVRTLDGVTIAAVSASGPKAEFEGVTLHRIIGAVQSAAEQIGRRLGAGTVVQENRPQRG